MAPITKPSLKEIESKIKFETPKKPNILRTIYMPNYEVDGAKDEIDKLR